ncbi:hypothetical protein [Variovorax sp. OV329]|uniref:hypothetical protein n=1 Tax=Variovorax sp. OV329 TaxID=1882825 RepID=UPI0008E29938|nr:hypothetical protein [Variovorax sp. OV329]SFN41359.1 hypothetical protein SAMN05444747_12531 [Variovorax sp. OV329]
MEAIPIAVFWTFVLVTLLQRKEQALMYLFFASMPFGSFAAIPTEVTGGLTLTPTPIVAMLLIARRMLSPGGVRTAVDAALKSSQLLPLFLFWLVAAVTTAFVPRLLAGVIEIVPVRSVGQADTALLAPTTQNISQLVYVSISVLAVFSFAHMLRAEAMQRHAMRALCLGAALTVLTGVLDLASQYLPIGPALELFRTASYALLTDVELLDVKRLVGLMPEASSYGTLALGFLASLYFFRRAMPPGFVRGRLVPVLIVMLLLLTWMSTSSAAYLGLGLFALAVAGDWCWRMAVSGRILPQLRRGLAAEFWLGALGAAALGLFFLAMPQVLASMREIFDLMVLQKSASSSYEERGMWTQVSLHALMATQGLGVGLGSTRASNFAVALSSNAGLIATACYGVFLLQNLVLRKPPQQDPQARALLSAIRWSCLPPFFTSLLIATTPDFGLFNAFLYGFAVAVTRPLVFRQRQLAAQWQPSAALPFDREAHARH